MAICEKDAAYAKRLTDYILRKEEGKFEVLFFLEKEAYAQAEKKKEFDVLLFGEGFFADATEYGKKKKVIFLSEGNLPKECEDAEVLFKYQSADNLLRTIHYLIGHMIAPQEEKRIFLNEKKIIAVYSPWNHRMQMPFALAAAEEFSQKKKVLYLNFSVCRGFCKSTGIAKAMDMGDIFYLIRENEQELEAKYRSSIYSLGNFSVIPPPENPHHYMEWTKEEVKRFFQFLLEKTEYETFVLDIGCMIPGFFEILEMSSHIWILKEHRTRKDFGLEELRELFRKRNSGLNEKTNEVFLPGGCTQSSGRVYQIEEFYMGEIGRCVRRLLGEERMIGDGRDSQTDFRGDRTGGRE